MTSAASVAVAIARVIQRAALVLVAGDVRRTYQKEMIATFEDASKAAGALGSLAVWGLLLREVRDLATARHASQPVGVPVALPDAFSGYARRPRRMWIDASLWRQAWRSLKRRPAFLATAVLTLGAGTGITTAVFSLVDTVLIKPLPYPDADRLVTVYESSPSAREKTSLVAPARLADWHRLSQTFTALSGSYSENLTDTSAAEPERLEARRVTPHFFTVYGLPPLTGRTFTASEEQNGGPGAAVISERFWSRMFNRDPSAVGCALIIGGQPYQIVGVMPAVFSSASTDAWLPAQMWPGLLRQREARFLVGIGRLRPGVSLDAGSRDLTSVQASLAAEFPKTDAGWSAEIRPLKDASIGSSRRGLFLVFAAVVIVWIIGVANVAGLTLVQVHRRSGELAIRAALGASRGRVAGAVVREGILIATAGGALGAVTAAWLVSVMPAVLSTTPRINELTLDWRALACAAGTSLLAACVLTLVPAVAGTRPHIARIISGGRSITRSHRLQKGLVVGQVAFSVLLVGSATLLLRSYYNLVHVETGFDPSSVVTFHVGARWDEDRIRIGQLQQQLLKGLEKLPHVQAAGMTNFLPAASATLRYQVRVEGLTGSNADGSMTIGSRMISSGYLRAIRAPLVSGSWCPGPATDFKAPPSAMVNRRFVDAYAAGQNLVGRTLRVTGQGSGPPITITGIIGNLAEDGHATSPVPYVYTCATAGSWPDPEYVARTSDSRAFAADLRRIVRELDSTRAVFGLRPLQAVLDAALQQPRLDATMLSLFAGASLTLAAVGLYSLFMLVVSERAREIAVRLAIGAAPREMIRLVMTGAGRLLGLGIVLGVALTAAADRVLRGVLFGLSPLDAPALAAAATTLAVVSAIAVAGPALKAARISPIDALKGE